MGVAMALKTASNTELAKRFREFDEARVYIEKFEEHNFADVCAAIDYMLVHKEYYYLLKTLYNKRFDKGVEEVAEYLFLRLECLQRGEDQEILFRFLVCEKPFLRDKAFFYMVSCCKWFALERVFGLYPLDAKSLQILGEYGECSSVRLLMQRIAKEHEQMAPLIEKFFSVYGDGDA